MTIDMPTITGATHLLTAAQNHRLEHFAVESIGVRSAHVFDMGAGDVAGHVYVVFGGPLEIAPDAMIDRTGGYVLEFGGEKENHGYAGPVA